MLCFGSIIFSKHVNYAGLIELGISLVQSLIVSKVLKEGNDFAKPYSGTDVIISPRVHILSWYSCKEIERSRVI